MLKKINLNLTTKFEIAIATQEVSKMLLAFVDGREGIRSIGSEQGGIDKWDDFVVEQSDGSYTHIQVKRNIATDFSEDPVTRGRLTRGPNKGKPRPLSPLDQSMFSLATWSKTNNPATQQPRKKFCIEVPSENVLVKEGITINDFRKLCQDHLRSNSDIGRFKSLISEDRTVANIVTWLKSWCDFDDEAHVLKTLKVVELKTTGQENDIANRVKEDLARFFNSVDTVISQIESFVASNSTFTTAITAKDVMEKVSQFLRPEVRRWTQYHHDELKNSFNVDGIHDLRAGFIEGPDVVVNSLWGNDRSGILRLDAPVKFSVKLSQSLIRLALHIQNSRAFLKAYEGWRQLAKSEAGGTLGISLYDFDNLSGEECTGRQIGSSPKTLERLAYDDEASKLDAEMQKLVWREVTKLVLRHFEAVGSPLREALEARWSSWKIILEENVDDQERLCSAMLKPAAEREILIKLRVGLKTAPLIATGLFMLLVVSVCLQGSDNSFSQIGSETIMTARANKFWSGPGSEAYYTRTLVDEGKEKLLAAEASDVLILSSVEEPPGEYKGTDLAGGNVDPLNMAAAREPKVIVTYCGQFIRLVRNGDIDAIKAYLNSQLQGEQ